jgi:hypothetical protein
MNAVSGEILEEPSVVYGTSFSEIFSRKYLFVLYFLGNIENQFVEVRTERKFDVLLLIMTHAERPERESESTL